LVAPKIKTLFGLKPTKAFIYPPHKWDGNKNKKPVIAGNENKTLIIAVGFSLNNYASNLVY